MSIEIIEYRICVKCKKKYPLEEKHFGKKKRGWNKWCIRCVGLSKKAQQRMKHNLIMKTIFGKNE